MIVDAGDHLDLTAVDEEHPADDVELPQRHRRVPLPPPILLPPPAPPSPRQQTVAHQHPVHRHRRNHQLPGPATRQLVGDAFGPPARDAPAASHTPRPRSPGRPDAGTTAAGGTDPPTRPARRPGTGAATRAPSAVTPRPAPRPPRPGPPPAPPGPPDTAARRPTSPPAPIPASRTRRPQPTRAEKPIKQLSTITWYPRVKHSRYRTRSRWLLCDELLYVIKSGLRPLAGLRAALRAVLGRPVWPCTWPGGETGSRPDRLGQPLWAPQSSMAHPVRCGRHSACASLAHVGDVTVTVACNPSPYRSQDASSHPTGETGGTCSERIDTCRSRSFASVPIRADTPSPRACTGQHGAAAAAQARRAHLAATCADKHS